MPTVETLSGYQATVSHDTQIPGPSTVRQIPSEGDDPFTPCTYIEYAQDPPTPSMEPGCGSKGKSDSRNPPKVKKGNVSLLH